MPYNFVKTKVAIENLKETHRLTVRINEERTWIA